MDLAIFRNPNAAKLVALIREMGPVTRKEISDALRVGASTVTRLTNYLLDHEILEEIPDETRIGRQGFPTKLIKLRTSGLISAGVFIEPDRTLVGIFNSEGIALSEKELRVDERDFPSVIGAAADELRQQIAGLSVETRGFLGCGISYPGQHDSHPGSVFKTRQFSDWPSIKLDVDLAPYFDMPVYHMNDGKVAGLAELQYGSCKALRNFCYIWLSYGIGGAAIINQSLYTGKNNNAAEFGGIFPKSMPRPSGQDLLNTLDDVGLTFERLEDIPDDLLDKPVVQKWVERASEQIQWLSLIIARTYGPDAIVLGGSLSKSIIDQIHQHLVNCDPLGEDFIVTPPDFIRAEIDKQPHLGAASLPLYNISKTETKLA